MSSPLIARITADFDAAFPVQVPGTAAAVRRRRALQALTAAGLPVQRDENWRYANLRPLERARFVPAGVAGVAAALPTLPSPLEGFARYVFRDGVLQAHLSGAAASGGVAVLEADAQPVAASSGDAHDVSGTEAVSPDERFALLNAAFATGAVRLDVPAATRARVELLFVAAADAAQGATYPRLEVRLGESAQLHLIERHLSAGEAAGLIVSAVNAQVGAHALLAHYRLQDLNQRSTQIDTLTVQVARAGRYDLHAVSTGAQSARSTIAVRLAGEDASTTLAAAALGDRQQVQDTSALVTHSAARGRTTQTFRGIATGRARVACNGRIVVTAQGANADSQQSLRGLLAGAEAEVDLRPQLEIYTDAVRCTHGATSGKLDENMLFYLLSRGLDPDSAARLLKWAFLEDVVAQIEPLALRRQIETQLVGSLGDETLQELL